MPSDLSQAISVLALGGIIIYPTESVIGLGCDPFNEQAVNALLDIKQRDIAKGLILIASDWSQLADLIQPIDAERFADIQAQRNITWLFPKTDRVPAWIHGDSNRVAVRVTTHPIAAQLCEQFGNPIVSTSANFTGEPATKNFAQLPAALIQKVDLIIEQPCGTLLQPTPIRDALTDDIIRQ